MITGKKKRFISLQLALTYVMLLATALAVVIAFVIRLGGIGYIDNKYLSDERREEREQNFVNDLQDYANRNALSSENTAEIAKWVNSNRYIYAMIFKDDQLLFDSTTAGDQIPGEDGKNPDTDSGEGSEGDSNESTGQFPSGGLTVGFPTVEALRKYAEENDSHEIELSDGYILISMVDFTEYLYYDIVNVSSIVAAFLAFVITIMVYFQVITRRISRLASDVNRVADGEISHNIRTHGRNEIARLSENVENMRSTIVHQIEREREALDANAQLIAAMSHDIRTPLTVLLGYLDMMKKQNNDDTMKSYIRSSERTANRLKKLSDDMFNYFLVFGSDQATLNMEEYELGTLLEQLLAEHVLLLGEQGYTVEVDEVGASLLSGYRVLTDATQLMRMIENFFSNIYKYADKDYPVSIGTWIEGSYENETVHEKLKLVFTNRISKDIDKAESNKIGLKTCAKIAEALGIEMEISKTEEIFSVVLTLPTENK